jgi:uncharacterized membrane protein YtjA (UPF0391 family)
MSEPANPGELDLERAQFDQPVHAEIACQLCRRPPGASYFSLNGNPICARCLAQQRAGQRSSLVTALVLGTAAGALGAAVYYGIRALTGYDLALITIVLGIMVGLAVRRGAGGSASVLYRVLAVALTWIAMCSTYVPMIAAGMARGDDGPGLTGAALWIASIVFSLAMPLFMVSEMEVLGLIIFAFGLWEAWRLSAPRSFLVEGPFVLAPAEDAAEAAAEDEAKIGAAPPA